MKVIKEGKWNVPWTGTYACPTCEAELLVEEKDVKSVDYSYKYCCACCVCGRSIDIPDKDLPLRVKDTVDKNRKWPSSD